LSQTTKNNYLFFSNFLLKKNSICFPIWFNLFFISGSSISKFLFLKYEKCNLQQHLFLHSFSKINKNIIKLIKSKCMELFLFFFVWIKCSKSSFWLIIENLGIISGFNKISSLIFFSNVVNFEIFHWRFALFHLINHQNI